MGAVLPSQYHWRWGTPRIELEVSFETEELDATRDIAHRWYDAQPPEFQTERPFVEPGNSHTVRVLLNGDFWKAGDTFAERAQFRGLNMPLLCP
jgi:hypothetical protein